MYFPPLHKYTLYSESEIIANQAVKKKLKKVMNKSDNVKERKFINSAHGFKRSGRKWKCGKSNLIWSWN